MIDLVQNPLPVEHIWQMSNCNIIMSSNYTQPFIDEFAIGKKMRHLVTDAW